MKPGRFRSLDFGVKWLLLLALLLGHGAVRAQDTGNVVLDSLSREVGRLYEAEKYTEGIEVGKEVVSQTKKLVGYQHPDYATSLSNLANLYKSMERYAEAETRFLEVLTIDKQQFGAQHPDYASSLNNLAALYKSMGRYAEAEPRYLEALAIRKQQLGSQHPDYASTLNNLAGLYESMERYTEAEAANAQATAVLLQHLRGTFTGLSEHEKQQFLAKISGSTEIYHSILTQLLPTIPRLTGTADAYNTTLFTKGLLLAATAGMQRQLAASPDTALRRRFGQWQSLKRQLAAARALPLAQQHQRGLDPAQLDQQANTLEKELAAKSAAFRQGANLPTAIWQQVQKALRPGEVAIELVRYRWFRRTWTDTIYYAAYVLTPTSQAPQLVVLRNGNALESCYLPAYRQLTHSAGGGRGLVDGTATAEAALADPKVLYQAFWQPIAQALPPGTRTVYLSADGVYQQLNLNTLQNPATSRFLLDELDLRLLGSTRELVPDLAATPARAGGAGVLVGNPAYRLNAPLAVSDAPASSRSTYSRSDNFLAAGEVPALPGTAQEVQELDALFTAAQQPHQRYTGSAATEEVVRDLHRPRLLHIATHGFFVSETAAKPIASQELSTAQLAAATDPLLRSGLLLAGVSNFRDAQQKPATEDGILTAYEASLLDLQGTELVVLSACETGLGQVQNGEGVYGLQRGFTVAGARSILMSLWKVDDAVTRELMVAFYKSWLLKGKSKRAALLAAQKQIREHHPQPYYWGAFVLVGE